MIRNTIQVEPLSFNTHNTYGIPTIAVLGLKRLTRVELVVFILWNNLRQKCRETLPFPPFRNLKTTLLTLRESSVLTMAERNNCENWSLLLKQLVSSMCFEGIILKGQHRNMQNILLLQVRQMINSLQAKHIERTIINDLPKFKI